MSGKKMTMGVIIGNRGFFPDQLAKSGREEMIQALAKAGMDCVVLRSRRQQARRGRDSRGSQALRGVVPEKSRKDRWRDRLAAELR